MQRILSATGPKRAVLSDWLKALPLYPLPQHALSRLVLHAARARNKHWKNALIRWFVRTYQVDLGEAGEPDATAYPDFNSFFTRTLRPDARPLPKDPATLICPADGVISEIGRIDDAHLLQAKGRHFSVGELLGGDNQLATRFHGGHFVTVYLSPRDYHRVHMPAAGELRTMIHVPGRLFSVAPHTVRTIPRLFSRNERVVSLFDTAHGPLAVILVGAICVASIETVWAGVVTPPRGRRLRRWHYPPPRYRLARGEELGRFNMGSTVIVLVGPERVSWRDDLAATQPVRMGQALGRFRDT
ncbi:archaetidylserine decarboxylase [Nitrococcus mobilis]|uniref:Phosphatidylserine decarboxylase proenzyme n=1 Tax=Nitrococcus mobilis Nb-231 TaxID=314278 RepID=A4BSZ1_9GAMM|nr:archaetidylserine decarboxylase [Nitrococcus mobilis]EAR21235.1 phosphatidylserine decarboxylase [Nitrococcus mobilis Nb-231]